jgi:hypothetical protein
MAGYKHKGQVELAWLENRDRLNLELRNIVRRLQDEVLKQASLDFDAALQRGEILELTVTRDEVLRMLSRSVLALGATNGDAE